MIINEKLKKHFRLFHRLVLSPILVVVLPSLSLALAARNSEFVYELLVCVTYYCNILAYKIGELVSCVVGCIAGSR